MARTVVGVLRGGASTQYALSLKSGAAVLAALPEESYDARDIFVDTRGMWHMRGVPATPARILSQLDVVLNLMHGGAGEDGTVARLLERAGVRNPLSPAHAAALAVHKVRARDAFRAAGIRTPQGVWFSLQDGQSTARMAREVFDRFGPPYIVKPASGGAGHGMRYAATLLELPDAIGDVLDNSGAALVEEFIRGKEATVGIVENFRNEPLYALPPAHVVPGSGTYGAVFGIPHADHPSHVVPAPFNYEEKTIMIEAARAAHKTLGVRNFSRSDMIMTPRALYLLEVNTVPSLYAEAALPHMLSAVGSSIGEFAEHLIKASRT